ncbi:MAG: hypothetical protein AB7N61_16805 [Acidimicrobiia bacterium]
MAVIALVTTTRHGTSWHYFNDAAHALIRPLPTGPDGGLDLYASHPEFQFGPISIMLAAPFAFLPHPFGTIGVVGFALILGFVSILAIDDAVGHRRESIESVRYRWPFLTGAAIASASWTDIAVRTAHLDDALALAATCVAVAAARRDRAWVTVGFLAVAAAAKPWAIVFLPLALVPAGRGRWLRPIFIGALVAVSWLPFVIDEPATLSATRAFKITNAAASSLRTLGFNTAGTPDWVRPAQFALGLLAAGWAVRRRRPHAVVMAGLGVRLMLDPGVHHYYTAGLTLGVLMWELQRRPNRIPWATALTCVFLELSSSTIHPAALAGTIRLVITATAVIAAVTLGDPQPAPADQEPR